jgi:hypothetical protein
VALVLRQAGWMRPRGERMKAKLTSEPLPPTWDESPKGCWSTHPLDRTICQLPVGDHDVHKKKHPNGQELECWQYPDIPIGSSVLKINDVEVLIPRCHCGAAPTEADALKSIKEREVPCSYCKEPIKLTHLDMGSHEVRGDVSSWCGSWSTEPSVDVGTYNRGTVPKRVHVRCWEKIFNEKFPAEF